MTRLCVTCPTLSPSRKQPRHYDRAQCCEQCRDRMRADLRRLPDLFALLFGAFAKLAQPQLDGSKIRSTPGSTEPVNWTAFDLTLPANQGQRQLMTRGVLGLDPDQHGDLSVATELDTWVRDWATLRREHLPVPTVSSLCGWLLVRLDDACDKHPAIDEFAATVKDLVRSVVSASRLDTSRGHRVGRCPELLRDGTRCGTALRVDPFATHIQCGRCDSSWDRSEGSKRNWFTLAIAQGAVEASMKEMTA